MVETIPKIIRNAQPLRAPGALKQNDPLQPQQHPEVSPILQRIHRIISIVQYPNIHHPMFRLNSLQSGYFQLLYRICYQRHVMYVLPHPFEPRSDIAASSSKHSSTPPVSGAFIARRSSSCFQPHMRYQRHVTLFSQPYFETTTRRDTINRLFALSIYRAQPKLPPSNSNDGSTRTHKAQIVFSPSKDRHIDHIRTRHDDAKKT